jgi:hypothetical protein
MQFEIGRKRVNINKFGFRTRKMQFYFEIENLVESVLIYTSLGSGLGK